MRRSRTTLGVLAVGALLTGCGATHTSAGGAPAQPLASAAASTSSSSVPAKTTSPEQPQQSGTPKCVAADMAGVFGPGDTVYSGTHQLSIVATNTSDHTCTVNGFGGLEMHTADGAVLQVKLTREAEPAQVLITLKPGMKAYKKLLWAFPRDHEEAKTCAQGGVYASVTMPDDTQTFDVRRPDAITICGDLKGYAWSPTDRSKEG